MYTNTGQNFSESATHFCRQVQILLSPQNYNKYGIEGVLPQKTHGPDQARKPQKNRDCGLSPSRQLKDLLSRWGCYTVCVRLKRNAVCY